MTKEQVKPKRKYTKKAVVGDTPKKPVGRPPKATKQVNPTSPLMRDIMTILGAETSTPAMVEALITYRICSDSML